MNTLIIILHILICFILIIAVLLQSGKAADLAGSFGGVGSQTAFGPRGATTLLAKITTAAAAIFMLTSIGLWLISTKGEKSVMKSVPAVTETQKQPVDTKKAVETKKESPINSEKKSSENSSTSDKQK